MTEPLGDAGAGIESSQSVTKEEAQNGCRGSRSSSYNLVCRRIFHWCAHVVFTPLPGKRGVAGVLPGSR